MKRACLCSQRRFCWEVSQLERSEGCQGVSQAKGTSGRRERPRQRDWPIQGSAAEGARTAGRELKGEMWRESELSRTVQALVTL